MSPVRAPICHAVLLGLIHSCVNAQVTPMNRARSEEAVRELENDMSGAFATKNLDALITLYAENAALYDDQGPMIRGKDSIRKAWSAAFTSQGLTMSTEPSKIEISNTGNLAWVHGIFSMATAFPDRPASDKWEYALIYTKQPDGKWKIMADSAHALLQHHLHPAEPERGWRSAIGALFWWATYIGSLLFLLFLPFVTIASIWHSLRSRKVTTSLLICIAMKLAFAGSAVIFWKQFGAPYWNLPLSDAFAATGDSARYGNPVEDTAEDLLIPILVFSTFSALILGAITGFLRRAWIRHHSPA